MTAIHPANGTVSQNPVTVIAEVRKPIGLFIDIKRNRRRDRAGAAVGPAVVEDFEFLRDDGPVFFGACFDVGGNVVDLTG